jgi:hypothetical protein
MTTETLLRLGPHDWVNPADIAAVRWFSSPVTEHWELRIWHPAAWPAMYFVVARDCELDVVKALGIEPRPPIERAEAAEKVD